MRSTRNCVAKVVVAVLVLIVVVVVVAGRRGTKTSTKSVPNFKKPMLAANGSTKPGFTGNLWPPPHQPKCGHQGAPQLGLNRTPPNEARLRLRRPAVRTQLRTASADAAPARGGSAAGTPRGSSASTPRVREPTAAAPTSRAPTAANCLNRCSASAWGSAPEAAHGPRLRQSAARPPTRLPKSLPRRARVLSACAIAALAQRLRRLAPPQ